MNKKKSGIKHLLLRVAACFVTGVFISMILISGEGAFAWFTGIATGKASVSVMSTEDILGTFKVDKEQNPTKIVISRAEGLDFSPVLFFAVEGEISKYLLHIDPVRLDGRAEVDMPLAISLDQYRELQEDLDSESGQRSSDEVEGTIRVKYLNEFIDEPLAVTFSKEYLMEEFERGCERIRGEDARVSSLGEEVKEYSLSKTLQGIIELLAPGLQDYISGLIEKVSEFTQEIAELTERLSVLEALNQALMLEIEELESQKGLGVEGGLDGGLDGGPDGWSNGSGGLVPYGLDGGLDSGTDGMDGSLDGGLDGMDGSLDGGLDGMDGSLDGGLDGMDGSLSGSGDPNGSGGSGGFDGGTGGLDGSPDSGPDGGSNGSGGDDAAGDITGDGTAGQGDAGACQGDAGAGQGDGVVDQGDDAADHGEGGSGDNGVPGEGDCTGANNSTGEGAGNAGEGGGTNNSTGDGDGGTNNSTGDGDGGTGGTGETGTGTSGSTGGTGSDTPGTGGESTGTDKGNRQQTRGQGLSRQGDRDLSG
jgi:hypothetical protein